MAVTVTVARQAVSNGLIMSFGTILFDSSYPTGGEAITANNFKLGDLSFDLRVHPQNGYTFEHDKTNNKILAYRVPTHTHTLHVQTSLTGGALQGTANNLRAAAAAFDIAGVADSTGEGGVVNVAAAAMAEVGNAVDLSAVTAKFEASGAY